jgi:hypothetical protein
MRFLVVILALLISASAFGHEGFKHRDRWTDEHGVPYGGQNPPVRYAGNTGAHCMYSAYGCSGAGGSTGPRGYSPCGVGGCGQYSGYGYGSPQGLSNGCGTHQNRGGQAGVHNGNVAGNVYMNQSRGNCGPNGYSQQNRGGNVGVVNGQVTGGVYFNESSTN